MIVVLVACVVDEPDVPSVPLQSYPLVPVDLKVVLPIRAVLVDCPVDIGLLVPIEEGTVVSWQSVRYHNSAH